MPEVKFREAPVEAVKMDPKEEIVALYCFPRKKKDGQGQFTDEEYNAEDLLGVKVEVTKAGEHNFQLRNTQFVRMKRGVAEFHVLKHRGTLDHKLDLKILTLDELDALKRTGAIPSQTPTERDEVIGKLLKLGVLKNVDAANGVELDELKEMLESGSKI